MSLALSTSWNAYRHKNAAGMLFEIKQLGFSCVELSFNLTPRMLSEAPSILKNLKMDVLSIHNYCPIPGDLTRQEALPDCYSLSSLDHRERKLALKYTKRSVDTAARLGAKVLVLHCGRVEMNDKTKKLINLYAKDSKECLEFKKIKSEFVLERFQKSKAFFTNALRSIEELSKYAQKKGISLGIENRFYYREIPDFEELGVILKTFKGANVFYWHDTGHARVMQNLGFVSRGSLLKNYSGRLIGVHLHNTLGCRDHLAPFKGDLNFSDIKSCLSKNTIKIIEAHYPASADEIVKSKSFLEKTFGDLN